MVWHVWRREFRIFSLSSHYFYSTIFRWIILMSTLCSGRKEVKWCWSIATIEKMWMHIYVIQLLIWWKIEVTSPQERSLDLDSWTGTTSTIISPCDETRSSTAFKLSVWSHSWSRNDVWSSILSLPCHQHKVSSALPIGTAAIVICLLSARHQTIHAVIEGDTCGKHLVRWTDLRYLFEIFLLRIVLLVWVGDIKKR